MRPDVSLGADAALGRIVVLIIKREAAEFVSQFKHLYQRTQDPAERYDSVIKFLAAAYYQRPQEFDDELTALFGPDSQVATRLVESSRCALDFEQFNQRYHLPCAVRELASSELAYQATFWHNSLFNPNLPRGVRVLGFTPRWWTIDTQAADRAPEGQ